MNRQRHTQLPMARQRGAALLIGLLILVIVSLLSLSAMQTTLLEERMTGNVRESNDAFQTAEDIVRQVEDRVRIAAETGTTGGIDLLTWRDANLTVSDCSGKAIMNSPDPAAGWPDAPSNLSGRDTQYRAIEMSSVAGRAVSCKPLEEEPVVGAGNRSSYYMILGYAEGPARRADSLVVTLFYYED